MRKIRSSHLRIVSSRSRSSKKISYYFSKDFDSRCRMILEALDAGFSIRVNMETNQVILTSTRLFSVIPLVSGEILDTEPSMVSCDLNAVTSVDVFTMRGVMERCMLVQQAKEAVSMLLATLIRR